MNPITVPPPHAEHIENIHLRRRRVTDKQDKH